MEYTKKLADFCAHVSYGTLPKEVVHKAKLCVLDYIANIYGSLELKAVKNTAAYFRSLGGPRQATALGCGFKTGLHHAAFINGTTAEAIEAQDGLRFGGNHPCSAVLPAVFSVAEAYGGGGKKIIEAVVAGYEAASRPAAAMHPYHTLSGFLPTGTCGTFGAAAAAARLMNFKPAAMLDALGNAGFLLPISMAEQLMGGYTIKITQGGQAAVAGITAAGLAKAGITGSPLTLEGSELKGGFTQITVKAEPKFERITEKLGEHFSIMDIYFKPYTACRHTHGAAQATLELLKEKRFGAGDVQSVDVDTYGVAVIAVGKPVPDRGTFVSAQFSIPYVVAVCILDRALGPKQLTEKRIADPAVIALHKKVSVKLDDELNRVYPEKTSSRVTITLKNGQKLVKQVDIPKGDPRDPMEADDIADKVRWFAGRRDRKKTEKIISLVMGIDRQKDIKGLAGLI